MARVIDSQLVGYWSDEVLYLGDMEANDVGFRTDGSGFTYWTRVGGVFEVGRFRWHIDSHGRLSVRFLRRLSGTWTVRGDDIRHRVDRESASRSTGATAYVVKTGRDVFGNPATLLVLSRPIGLGGSQFAFKNGGADDPTLASAVPRGRL